MRDPAPMIMPDYHGGSIVNLMASIVQAFEAEERLYPPLRALPAARRQDERNYIYAYWPELDRLAHEHGIASRGTCTLASTAA